MPQYLLSSFFPQAGVSDRFRKESSQIAAPNDEDAIRQAREISRERKTDRYTVTLPGSVAERIVFVSSAR